ncbi:hypothetical protein NQ318_023415 [Aromia moschata]|uniref:Uncharacterized protein n=1 Tax=Aromia moschata TaxID=1265417 RepID=A0AAV8YVQ5_9CUCU|nr:hypothetical protein NQ318_023415 [Aromia moschata]
MCTKHDDTSHGDLPIQEIAPTNCRQCTKDWGIDKSNVRRTIKRFEELGHTGRRPGSGRRLTVRTVENREGFRERVRRNPRVSMRKIARQTGINRESIRQIAKEDLHLKPYKLQKVQLPPTSTSAYCLKDANNSFVSTLLFKRQELVRGGPQHVGHRRTRQNPAAVMVWAGICASGKTLSFSWKRGQNQPRSVPPRHSRGHRTPVGSTALRQCALDFTVPAQRAKMTQDWCKAHFPEFSIWSTLEGRACVKPHKSLEAVKRSLRREWDRLSPEEVRGAAENFRKRLVLCRDAQVGHFETD